MGVTVPLDERFWKKVAKVDDGCWIWTGAKSSDGYGSINVEGRTRGAHIVAWELTHGHVVTPGMNVCHRCDNPPCCRPDHLFEGSDSDNMRDAVQKGRLLRSGESNSRAKLTVQDVLAIRSAKVAGTTLNDLAAQYYLTPQGVRRLCLGITWPDAGGPILASNWKEQERSNPANWSHGKRSTYRRNGCRCSACRIAEMNYKHKWRQQRRLNGQPYI